MNDPFWCSPPWHLLRRAAYTLRWKNDKWIFYDLDVHNNGAELKYEICVVSPPWKVLHTKSLFVCALYMYKCLCGVYSRRIDDLANAQKKNYSFLSHLEAAAADFASLISRAPHTGFNAFWSFRPAVYIIRPDWLSCSRKVSTPKSSVGFIARNYSPRQWC